MAYIDCELIISAKANDLDAVSRLLQAGADVHAEDDFALKYCAEIGNLDMVTLLLKHGANLHAQHDYALRWSAGQGYLDIVTQLLKFGADVDAGKGTNLQSPLEFSVSCDHLNVVIKLLECNADMHLHDDRALQISVCDRNFKIMGLLLENGADLYCNNKQILKDLCINFDKKIADIILPYCDVDDYEYFPDDYIRECIIPTKNANVR